MTLLDKPGQGSLGAPGATNGVRAAASPPPPPPHPGAAAKVEHARIRGLDGARIIASLATVWFHTVAEAGGSIARTAAMARFAVSYFSMVSAYLLVGSLRRDPARPFVPFAGSRVRRLYLPLLGWSAIYLLASEAKHRFFAHDGKHAQLTPIILIEGSHFVLWFLPYLLVMTIVAFPIVRWAVRERQREVGVGLSALALGIAMSMWPWHGELDVWWNGHVVEFPWVIVKGWGRGPAYLWGLALALLWRPRPGSEVPAWVAAVGAAVMAASMAGSYWLQDMNLLMNLTGVGLFLVALGPTPLSRSNGLSRLGRLTYGVYLSHWLFVDGLRHVLDKLHVRHDWVADVGVFCLAAGGSVMLTFVLRRTRWTSWLAP